jgi:hypothetical protein
MTESGRRCGRCRVAKAESVGTLFGVGGGSVRVRGVGRKALLLLLLPLTIDSTGCSARFLFKGRGQRVRRGLEQER